MNYLVKAIISEKIRMSITAKVAFLNYFPNPEYLKWAFDRRSYARIEPHISSANNCIRINLKTVQKILK